MKRLFPILTLAAVVSGPLYVQAQDTNFGTSEDQTFGNELWSALVEQKLVGDDAIVAKPYEGTDPHGSVLITLESEVEVDGEQSTVIVKHNYMGQGVSVESVSDNPNENLMATTVMLKREGFNSEGNWFWAKFMPDGNYDKTPEGVALVGNVGMCVSCHEDAPGGDLVFLNDRH